jgi:hypothetical protein
MHNRGRNISVDVRGTQEALRNLYGASALADELTADALSDAAAKNGPQ